MVTKDRDTLIEQSLCTKYSNRAVTHACKLEILQLIFTDAQQNRKNPSKILSKIGENKRIAGKKNRWKKKQNRLIPKYKSIERCCVI